MKATILHQNVNYAGGIDLDEYGEWVNSQDPITGEIVQVWIPYEDNPSTPDEDESVTFGQFPCIARGIVDGGIRVAGTTERFGDTYENIDYVKMWVPAHVRITKNDRVTNIKDATGRIRWRDEEYEQRDPNNPIDLSDPETYNEQLKATVFNVNGVTPLFNAFNRMTEQFVLLERASDADASEG